MGYQGFPIGKRHDPLFPPGSSNRFLMESEVQTVLFPTKVEDGNSMRGPRLLFIDAYDSFSNNIIALLHDSLTTADEQPAIEKITIDQAPYWPINDTSRELFAEYLSGFDAVIAGPGPGDPANAKDVGLIRCLWTLPEEQQLPVLGICLGFQSMCLDAGASVIRLAQGRHGIVTEIDHCNKSIFADIGHLTATHYHSLHVNIDHPMHTGIGFHSSAQMWKASLSLPRIVPLAWDCSPPSTQSHGTRETKQKQPANAAILMAARIEASPWWGVQYHPESICSGRDEAKLLLSNWWREARDWLEQKLIRSSVALGQNVLTDPGPTTKHHQPENLWSDRPAKRLKHASDDDKRYFAQPTSALYTKRMAHKRPELNDLDSDGDDDPPDADDSDDDDEKADPVSEVRSVPAWFGGFKYSSRVDYKKIFVPEGARPRVVQHVRDILQTSNRMCSVLESGQSGTHRSTGRFSIIGIVDNTSIMMGYYRADRTVRLFRHDGQEPIFEASGVDFGTYWLKFRKHFHAGGGHELSPFWGGAMMCFGYEACLDTIQASLEATGFSPSQRPDIFGIIVMRSVVIDHFYHDAWIQSIAPEDEPWLEQSAGDLIRAFDDPGLAVELQDREERTEELLKNEVHPIDLADIAASHGPTSKGAIRRTHGTYSGPSKADYEAKVMKCQDYIAAGDSYELCLTGQTAVQIPLTQYPRLRDDLLYKNLTSHNPAPFGARIQLTIGKAGVTVFSSSPERFLRWDRNKRCEFRPIKGTLAKTEGTTKEAAVEYFKSTKERAENLMITDLIRHDLYGVLQQPDSVRVAPEKLFQVEEYSTVFQLVTAIEGYFHDSDKTGNDVLNASLPPGSMTGAPKKRSCELLQEIEEFKPRGLYSGVLGYDDVGGGGDFSVTIRAAVLWDEDIKRKQDRFGNVQNFEQWTIGAGGAVTALSDPTDEYNEMITKRSAVLQAFMALPGQLTQQS